MHSCKEILLTLSSGEKYLTFTIAKSFISHEFLLTGHIVDIVQNQWTLIVSLGGEVGVEVPYKEDTSILLYGWKMNDKDREDTYVSCTLSSLLLKYTITDK